MKPWMLPVTALVGALISAGVVVGVMAWEPWTSDSGTPVPDRIVGCERAYTIGDYLHGRCIAEARSSEERWACYVKYPDSVDAREACRDLAKAQPTPPPEPTPLDGTPSLEDDVQYSIELLDIVRDMTTMNEGVAEPLRSYLSCASDGSCQNATVDALMTAFRRSRPALVDLMLRTKALSERSQPTFDEFTASLLSSFQLRLEGQDDMELGWVVPRNDALFLAGAEKFDEAGIAYTEAIGNFPLEESAP